MMYKNWSVKLNLTELNRFLHKINCLDECCEIPSKCNTVNSACSNIVDTITGTPKQSILNCHGCYKTGQQKWNTSNTFFSPNHTLGKSMFYEWKKTDVSPTTFKIYTLFGHKNTPLFFFVKWNWIKHLRYIKYKIKRGLLVDYIVSNHLSRWQVHEI